MKWSTALFGHYKPKTLGWEKKAEPGDLIDFKPEKCWNCDEQQHKEIVRMLRSKGYLMNHRQEIKDRFIELTGRTGEVFDYIWKGTYLQFWLNNPAILPEDIRTYFSFLPGASIWHFYGRSIWGEGEWATFLIVNLDGPTKEQLAGLLEPYWDTNSYPEYTPMSKAEFEMQRASKVFDKKGVQGLHGLDLDSIEEEYNEYLKAESDRCRYPVDYIKERRMSVPLSTLQSLGVDLSKMLNRNFKYEFEVELGLFDCWDKLKMRNIEVSDKLRVIDPRY